MVPLNGLIKPELPLCGSAVLLMGFCIHGVFTIQTVVQEGQAQAWRAVNRTAAACLEAHGMRMQRTTVVSVISPVKVCLTTRYEYFQSHFTTAGKKTSMHCVKKLLFVVVFRTISQTNWSKWTSQVLCSRRVLVHSSSEIIAKQFKYNYKVVLTKQPVLVPKAELLSVFIANKNFVSLWRFAKMCSKCHTIIQSITMNKNRIKWVKNCCFLNLSELFLTQRMYQ